MTLWSFSSPPVRVLLAVLAAAWLVLVPAGAGRAATAGGGLHNGRTAPLPRLPHRGLASILRSDGTLRSAGVQGSFGTAGYRMTAGRHGAPRFVRTASAPGDTNWSDRFGDPGVQANGVQGGQVNAIAVDGSDVYVGGSPRSR